MGHLYNFKYKVVKKNKLTYFSSKLWRIMYLITLNPIYHNAEKRIRTRSATIPMMFLGYEVIIYSGKRWHTRRVNQWMIGFKFGEFTWNRKLALFKAKQLKKKKKK